VVSENLKRSFPDKTPAELATIRRKFYRHFTDLLAEGIKNLTISQKELKKRFTVQNPEILEQLYAQKKSVLLVSGHYNNWEWLISAQNFLFSHQAMGIGMPMSSSFWNKKINARRERFGMIVVHAKNFRQEIARYQNKKPLAILTLSDQSPGDSKKSYWMTFLHQPTAVLFGAELMAHQYDFAVVFYSTKKQKRGYYQMELKTITDKPREKKWGEITQEHTRLLENEINKNPAYWLWSHKRWKREIPDNIEALKAEQQRMFVLKINELSGQKRNL